MWPDAFALPAALVALAIPLALLWRRLRQRAARRAVPVHASALFGPLPRTWRERLLLRANLTILVLLLGAPLLALALRSLTSFTR